MPNIYTGSGAEARRDIDIEKLTGLNDLAIAAKLEVEKELSESRHNCAMMKIAFDSAQQRIAALNDLIGAKDARIAELENVLKGASAQLVDFNKMVASMELERAELKAKIQHEQLMRDTLVQSAANEAESKSESIY